jgi:RimJ/RimL family protein N-acetyltransferase
MFAHGPPVNTAYRRGMTVSRALGIPQTRTRERPAAMLHRAKEALASAGVRRPRVLRGPRTERPFDAPTLRTERLLLRPHRMTDAADWYALQSEKGVTAFLPWPVRDERASARHLHDRTRHTRLWQAEDFLALGLEHEGRLIGDVSLQLHEVRAHSRSAEIGWVLHPRFGGSGLATEAASQMLAFAFDVVGAQRVTAVTDARNLRSVALARRLGFTEVAGPRHGSADSVFALER